ncbi:hypothetical protein QN277_013295 [Acacia crassicarpa]|uniref:DUF4283 domain-containing protein n=1 Tax=Acacia crassicarpa TaxID=499986 RepID=A0AAE1N2C1_9FABA|nr:hypothetical protein QN277_013295 [Acacia crassicarpa]
MAMVVLKKKNVAPDSGSTEDDDLLRRDSKKIKNGTCLDKEEWPSLSRQGAKVWEPGKTFAERLQGINLMQVTVDAGEDARMQSENISSDSEMDDSEPLCKISEDVNRNFPKFVFSGKMTKRLHKAWKCAVIVKLLGRSIGYRNLLTILQTLWAKRGVISLINVGNGFFVVKLTNREDYMNALTGGPWMIFDHYLTVRPWEPLFNPWRATIDKVAVWVRMPKLPLEFYDKEALTWIGNRIGETLKIDFNTSCQLRGHYARICVLIDLSKQLMPGFTLAGEDYYVEYEGLHGLCANCGVFGHKMEQCKAGVCSGSSSSMVNRGEKNREDVEPEAVVQCEDVWKVVKKSPRKKKEAKDNLNNKQSIQGKGSRFGVLADGVKEREYTEGESGQQVASFVGDVVGFSAGGNDGVKNSRNAVRNKESGGSRKHGKAKKVIGDNGTTKMDQCESRSEKRQRDQRGENEILRLTWGENSGGEITMVGPVESSKVNNSNENNSVEAITSNKGPTHLVNMVGPVELFNGNEEMVVETTLDPGDAKQVLGPSGKFWADSQLEDNMEEENVVAPFNADAGPSKYLA